MGEQVALLTSRDLSQLRWLASQAEPTWGGAPYNNPDDELLRWLKAGLIDRVSSPTRGYRITPAGRRAIAGADRDGEGHLAPHGPDAGGEGSADGEG